MVTSWKLTPQKIFIIYKSCFRKRSRSTHPNPGSATRVQDFSLGNLNVQYSVWHLIIRWNMCGFTPGYQVIFSLGPPLPRYCKQQYPTELFRWQGLSGTVKLTRNTRAAVDLFYYLIQHISERCRAGLNLDQTSLTTTHIVKSRVSLLTLLSTWQHNYNKATVPSSSNNDIARNLVS